MKVCDNCKYLIKRNSLKELIYEYWCEHPDRYGKGMKCANYRLIGESKQVPNWCPLLKQKEE